MKIIADLHLHSKYSRAVSQEMALPQIATWVKKKGIGLVGTGDWTHPLWLREIKANFEEVEPGLYGLKSNDVTGHELAQRPLFLLSTEISSIYSQGGKLRRIHNLVLAPSIEVVEKVNSELTRRGANLMSDGRPITGISAQDLVKIILSVNEKCLIIPAHVWTPWFSLYGSESGFDSMSECFGGFSKYIYAVETGLSCYDEDTEVLTHNGWKKFSEVQYSNKICTLSLKNNEIEFQKPTKLFKYQYKGKMYRLKTRRVDLLVTPNHKLLVRPCDFHTLKPYFLEEAKLLFNKSKIFKKDGIWIGENMEYFTLPSVEIKHGSRYYSGSRKVAEKKFPMESWLKFFGFWIAEGWTTEDKNGEYNICLANQNSTLLVEMKELLQSFGYNAYQAGNTLRVRDFQLFHYLKQFGKSSDKFVPSLVKCLLKELLEIFLEYYLKGDGHVYGRNKKGLSATTSSVRLRDDLQEIALKVGISAYFKRGAKKGSLITALPYKNKLYRNKQDIWQVYFIKQNRPIVTPSMITKYNYTESWVDFEGSVFCLAVPNKIIYIRRNGIPLWCSNSDPAMNWRIKELESRQIVSFSDAHSGPKLGREVTVFEVEELSYQAIREAIMDQGKIAYTIEFYPEEGKYHFTGHRDCKVRQSPEETHRLGVTCPVCGKHLTIGVMHRVQQLASREISAYAEASADKKNEKPASPTGGLKIKNDEFGVKWIGYENRPSYIMMVPLQEILAESLGSLPASQTVQNEYEKLTRQASGLTGELGILLETPLPEIAKISGEKVAEGIKKVRSGEIVVEPGYDGVFGVAKIWSFDSTQGKPEEKEQMSLFDS